MILISVEVPTQLQWYVIKGDKFFLKFTLLEILFFSFFLHYDFLVLFRIFFGMVLFVFTVFMSEEPGDADSRACFRSQV